MVPIKQTNGIFEGELIMPFMDKNAKYRETPMGPEANLALTNYVRRQQGLPPIEPMNVALQEMLDYRSQGLQAGAQPRGGTTIDGLGLDQLNRKEIISSGLKKSGKIGQKQDEFDISFDEQPKDKDQSSKMAFLSRLGEAGDTIGSAIAGVESDPSFWRNMMKENLLSRKQKKDEEYKDRTMKLKEEELALKRAKQKLDAAKTPEDKLKAATELRKEYNQLGTTKATNTVLEAFNKVKMAASEPSAAGDLSLIFNYMKMLDPGSVVREGEFANAQNAAGVPDRIRNLYNRAMSGERLNDNQRGDFINQAGNVARAQMQRQQQVDSRYSQLASDYGVNNSAMVVDQSLAGINADLNKRPQKTKMANFQEIKTSGFNPDAFLGGSMAGGK